MFTIKYIHPVRGAESKEVTTENLWWLFNLISNLPDIDRSTIKVEEIV